MTERKIEVWIFCIAFIGLLIVVSSLAESNNKKQIELSSRQALIDSLRPLADSAIYYREYCDTLITVNEVQYIELIGWGDSARRMRWLYGISDSLELNYQTKCKYMNLDPARILR